MRPLIVVLSIALGGGSALACSCGIPDLGRTIVPADGATGFPVDGQVRVFLTGGFPEEIRQRLGEEYRLVGPAGEVPLDRRLARTRLDLIPRALLAPDPPYVLEAVAAYDGDGWRLEDRDRLRALAAKRHWFPVVAFTTGRDRAPALGIKRWTSAGPDECGPKK